MLQALLVFFGGGLGAFGRWLFGLTAAKFLGQAWPWGTFGVNVIGGFLIGLATAQLIKFAGANPNSEFWRLFLVTGVLGGFTTFSAFSLETARLIEVGNWFGACFYSLASVTLSVGAVFAGMALHR